MPGKMEHQTRRKSSDSQVVLERDVEKLDVAGKPALAEQRKQVPGDVGPEGLDPALGVRYTAGHQHANEHRE